jgi:hypothetical protein
VRVVPGLTRTALEGEADQQDGVDRDVESATLKLERADLT